MAPRPTKEEQRDGLADRLRVVRVESGLGQSEFAEKIGAPRRTYVGWERGEHAPPPVALEALVREFGVDLHWLILGKGSAHAQALDASRFWRDAIELTAGHLRARKLNLAPAKVAIMVEAVVAQIRAGGKPTAEFLDSLVELSRR